MGAYQASMRVWRGDDTGGGLQDYTVEVNEGEVVLDIIHRIQATQAGDLAVRWNCKAGKCGSCSAEINGRPRLLCMTRMSTFDESETVTITPLRAFPVMRDLVTDVSFNYTKAREVPSFTPPKDLQPGDYRMQQVDVERSQEFRKCIECFLCQNTCHVVRDHEENKQAFAGTRHASAGRAGPQGHGPGGVRPRLLQHHQVLYRGLPRTHQDHRQRADPDEGARRRPQVRPGGVAREQALQEIRQRTLVSAIKTRPINDEGADMSAGETQSVNDIRTAIRELSARAELARKEGRPADAAEIERRIDGYREELGARP
jgi:succinate dehydrogenase/fumarate reductase iron-sulfur protein